MLSEHKLVQLPYDVLLVLWISLVQSLNQLSLNQALFIKSLLVL